MRLHAITADNNLYVWYTAINIRRGKNHLFRIPGNITITQEEFDTVMAELPEHQRNVRQYYRPGSTAHVIISTLYPWLTDLKGIDRMCDNPQTVNRWEYMGTRDPYALSLADNPRTWCRDCVIIAKTKCTPDKILLRAQQLLRTAPWNDPGGYENAYDYLRQLKTNWLENMAAV